MTKEHNCSDPLDTSSHVLSATYFLLEAIILITLNAIFIVILYKCRLHLNWKTSIFVLNVAFSDVISGIALMSLSISRYMYICDVAWWIENGIQLSISYSILITVLSYNSLYFVQFLAVQYPIFYQTRCTRSFFIKILLLQYVAVLGFETWKGFMLNSADEQWFSDVEVSVMSLSFVCNILTYSMVLHVVRQRQSITAKVKQGSRKSNSPELTNDNKLYHHVKLYFIHLYMSLTEDYWGVTTAGLHLLVYVATFVPFLIIYIVVIFAGSSDGAHDIYRCETTVCHMGMVIWFARGIVDPLLHIIRNPKLQILRTNKHSVTSNTSFTATTSVEYKTKIAVPTISETIVEK